LVKSYAEGDQKVQNALNDFEKGLDGNATSRQLGITFEERQRLKDKQYEAEL
jgi:hypothetical protein